MRYTADDIKVLNGPNAVRHRLFEYFDRATPETLATEHLKEMLCHGAENLAIGKATFVRVEVSPTGAILVEDDGPGFSGRPTPNGAASALERVLTWLHCGCHDEHTLRKVQDLVCRASLAAAVTLTEHMVVDSCVRGEHWRMAFRDGRSVGCPVLVGAAVANRFQIAYRGERSVLGEHAPDLVGLQRWWQGLDLPFPPGALRICADV